MHQHGWFSCRAKARFTEHEAQKRARLFGQRAYECSRCRGWHCTKSVFDNARRPMPTSSASPRLELERARRSRDELRRKNITGPLRDAAEAHVTELETKATQGGRQR